MFDKKSRYYSCQDATLTMPNGQTVQYKKRRFVPNNPLILQQIAVIDGDRIDLIASKTIGDPLQFWKICDANNTMHPLELVISGNVLKIPLPGG